MTVRWMSATSRVQRPRLSDCRDFWGAVTGMTTDADGTLQPDDGDAFLAVVPAATAGLRVAVHVDDVGDATERAVELGAVTLPGDAVATPAGQPIDLLRATGPRRRPAPVRRAGGVRSLLDQICVDIPAKDFEPEAEFWERFTGWPRAAGSLPEFQYLRRPAGQPLRVLLQRTEGDAPVRVHFDLACSDAAMEAEHHLGLGASWGWRGPHWITLRDPAGMEYCVTDRDVDTGRLFAP